MTTMVVSDSDRALVESADIVFSRVGAAQVELLGHVAEIDRRAFHGRDGYQSSAAYVSARYGISQWAARRWINAGHSLPYLPRVTEALRTGTLSLDKVLELVRLATPEDEGKLITWARRVSAAAIRRRADREARKDIEDTKDAERDRFFRWWASSESTTGFEGNMANSDAAKVIKAVTRLASKVPDNADDEAPTPVSDADTFEARSADALVWMASQTISGDSDADRATVVVHTELGTGTSYVEDGPGLHPEVARRISCDSRLNFVLEHHGKALGIGRTSRSIPPWLWRQLKHRDHGCCQFPGCGRRAMVQGHHIIHWEDGGPTVLCNLILVCHFHHKLLHDFGWSVWRGPDEVRWYRPDGRRFEPGPAQPARQSQLKEELPRAV